MIYLVIFFFMCILAIGLFKKNNNVTNVKTGKKCLDEKEVFQKSTEWDCLPVILREIINECKTVKKLSPEIIDEKYRKKYKRKKTALYNDLDMENIKYIVKYLNISQSEMDHFIRIKENTIKDSHCANVGTENKCLVEKEVFRKESGWDYLPIKVREIINECKSVKNLSPEIIDEKYRKKYKIKNATLYNDFDRDNIGEIVKHLSLSRADMNQFIRVKENIIKDSQKNEAKKKLVNETNKKNEQLEFAFNLKELGLYDYFEGFVFKVYMKLYDNEISIKDYYEKLGTFSELMSNKLKCEIDVQDFNEIVKVNFEVMVVNKVKSDIEYIDNLKTDDVIFKCLKYYGNNIRLNSVLYSLSEITKLEISQLVKKIEIIEADNINTYKLLELERELLDNQCFDIDNMEGYEFECFLEKLFINLGYSVIHTPESGDQGADLILQDNLLRVVVQAKRYNGSVGNKAVQEVNAAKAHYNCQIAVVITNSEFTKFAKDLALSNQVKLIARKELDEIISFGKPSFIKYIS